MLNISNATASLVAPKLIVVIIAFSVGNQP